MLLMDKLRGHFLFETLPHLFAAQWFQFNPKFTLNAPSTAIQLPKASGSNRPAGLDVEVLICYEQTRLFF